jgi:hypothetical protein
VPGDRQAHRLRQLRGGLALWLAVLLALWPLAQPFPTVVAQAARAAFAPPHAPDGSARRGEETALGLQDAGLLPRSLHLERALALPAEKGLLPRLAVGREPPKPEKGGPGLLIGTGFHRSSVGTARQPTGPPA